MAQPKNVPVNRHKLIIAVDFGTTYTGVSYVTTDKSDIDDIHIISSWPGEQHSMWKTPTRIAYARENPTTIQSNKWGFEVSPKLKSYSWTKLLLDKNATIGDHDDPALSRMAGSGMLRLPPFRDAAGVCEDFLREVYVYVSRKLRQQMTDFTFESTPLECWITLPAIWSDEAKEATLRAARNAGFGNRVGDEVYTIAEPEAAAIAVLKRFSKPTSLNAIREGENILIVDAGGGTCDLTSYVITQISPRLEFDELLVGVGGKCGSTYIDRNLDTLLSRRFGTSFDNLPFAQRGPGSKFMMSFETHKRSFGLSDDRDIREIGPIKMPVPDSDFYDEEERMVKLSYEDMRALFDPVIIQITNLVRQQVTEARQKKDASIDRIILVGGFAESPYLVRCMKDWCWRNGDITLICADNPQAAVVRGAALRGLEGIAPRVKHMRRHYGFSLMSTFREGIDPEENAYIDPLNNAKLCDNRMRWMISKGDEVVEGTFRTASCQREYFPGTEKVYSDELYSSALTEPPEYYTHPRVDKVGVIKSTFPADFDFGTQTQSEFNPRLNKTIFNFSYDIQVVFGSKGSNLKFKNVVNGHVVSSAVIEFDQT